MVDIIALLLFLALIYKAEYFLPADTINEQYLSKDSCKALKGFFAVVIVFVHISMKTTSGVVFHGFAYVGFIAVAAFFFISGYGLMKSMSAKEHYLDSFLRNKLFTLVLPYIIIILIYWGYSFLTESPYSAKEVFASLFNGVPVADNSWYIITCLIYYLAFYACAKISKGSQTKTAWEMLGFCVVWVALMRAVDYPQWWYLSALAFPAGMFWMIYEEEIVSAFKKHYYANMACLAVLMLISAFTTYRFESNIFKIVCASIFPAFVFAVCMKIRINSPVMMFLGKYSLEIYLIHGLLIRLFRSDILFVGNDFLYVAAALLTAVALAVPLNRLFKLIAKANKA